MSRRDLKHKFRVGTSGWSYQHWRERFYPADIPQKRWFEHYCSVFDTVEVNSTFYHMPKDSTYEGWKEKSPPGFLFALKASRFVTHVKKLANVGESLETFLNGATILGEKLGPILYQLPPSMKQDLPRLEAFLDLLPGSMISVFEFRHSSWYDDRVFESLRSRGASLCVHDMPYSDCPRLAVGPVTYVRFHGAAGRYAGSYSDRALRDWAQWLAGEIKSGRAAYAYFNNDAQAYAVHNAQTLRDMLTDLTRG